LRGNVCLAKPWKYFGIYFAKLFICLIHHFITRLKTRVPVFNSISRGFTGTNDLAHPDIGCLLVYGSSAEWVVFVTQQKKNAVCPIPEFRTAGKRRCRNGLQSIHHDNPSELHTIIRFIFFKIGSFGQRLSDSPRAVVDNLFHHAFMRHYPEKGGETIHISELP
jgi:hypothetical protein